LEFRIINIIISWGAVVLIWLVQLVHYPSFRYIDAQQFTAFHQHHTQSITFIVMPLMLAELGLAIYWVMKNGFNGVAALALVMVVAVWLSTFLIQIPLHHALGSGKNMDFIHQLVKTNWIRTVLWTAKAVLVTWEMWRRTE